jgi:hypothetical protein
MLMTYGCAVAYLPWASGHSFQDSDLPLQGRGVVPREELELPAADPRPTWSQEAPACRDVMTGDATDQQFRGVLALLMMWPASGEICLLA